MSVQNLRIYQDACVAATEIYKKVIDWPAFEKNTLGIQLVRAADSIGNNISEGYGRVSTGERLQFMFYADGSIQEVKTQLIHAVGRGLLEESFATDISHMLRRLSIALIEFCHVTLDRDPEYKGQFRKRVADRRKWKLDQISSNGHPKPD